VRTTLQLYARPLQEHIARTERSFDPLRDPAMRRLAPTLAVLATISVLPPADCAKALPLGSCRPPPWFRGWQTSVPFVCADYWCGRAITVSAWGRAIAELYDARPTKRPTRKAPKKLRP
jgi:hypothetical protein